MSNRQKIQAMVNRHAIKAQQSSYDRETCILAILKARETLMTIPDELNNALFLQQALQQLELLFNNYHDSNGVFTSGRAVIGSLLDDIRAEFQG